MVYFKISGSHYNVLKSIKLVLDAFVTSVRCALFSVRFQSSQLSTVPKRTFAISSLIYGQFSSIQRIL